MSKIKILFGLMKAPFLALTPACVAVGVGTAYWQTHEINWLSIVLITMGAVSAHICVNAFNEYFDFRSGLDSKTQRTPFSGGSGALPSHPEMEKTAFYLSWITFAVTAVIGFYFVWLHGWLLLPLGLFGLFLLVAYTTWVVYHPILCLLAPGLGFGVMMVMGTNFCLTGTYSWTSFVASLMPTFLVSNLLLLNQFPDVEADQSIQRRHLPITIGRKRCSIIYGVFLLLAYTSVVVGVIIKLLPLFCLIALLTSVLAWRVYRGTRQNAENIPVLIPFMGINVVINLISPLLLAIGLFIG
ncbi:MAG TPA: prenyltransferase [Bacteroidales bacterium]|nr:prenyltransferase [Bacteroidales bacterium]HPT21703.1 prenyltransferase [Bacteroidales bacterium]